MTIKWFEDIIAWKKTQDLAVNIHMDFKELKNFGCKVQFLRAVVSVSSNIAEGFDRSSDADFHRFLYFGPASTSEVKSLLYLANRLAYIAQFRLESLIQDTDEISKMIRGLMKALKR